jgi:hypothetical protein
MAWYGTPGFALGFSANFLKEVADKQDWYLASCIYDPQEQIDIVRALVEEVFEENVSPKPDDDSESAELFDVRIRMSGTF